jgi:hypothetical protein
MGCRTWFYRPITENEIPSDNCDYSYEEFGESKYTNVDTPHDIFNIQTNPKLVLFSLEETLEFIEKNREKIIFRENWEERLRDFWAKNPKGLIEFG